MTTETNQPERKQAAQMFIRWNEDLEGDLRIIERCIARWKRMPSCAMQEQHLHNLGLCRTDLLLIKTGYTLDQLHDKKGRR